MKKRIKNILKKSQNDWENQPRAGNGQFGSKKISSAAPSTTPQKSGGVASAQNLHHNNISFLDNPQEFLDVKNKLKKLADNIANIDLSPKEYLENLKQCFNSDDVSKSAYALKTFDGERGKLRISDHESVIKNSQKQKTKNTSIVISLNKKRGRRKNARIVEYIYEPESFTKGTQQDILNGIKDWLATGEFTGKRFSISKSFVKEPLFQKSYSKQVEYLLQKLISKRGL